MGVARRPAELRALRTSVCAAMGAQLAAGACTRAEEAIMEAAIMEAAITPHNMVECGMQPMGTDANIHGRYAPMARKGPATRTVAILATATLAVVRPIHTA